MTTRLDVIARALGSNGYLDGAGYDVPNMFSAYLGHPVEAWCGDFATAIYRGAGLTLPPMQTGQATGFAYCPSAVAYGRAHGIVIPSWSAQPGDLALFDWNGDGVSDHVELVEAYTPGTLHTIGGNSGPSNVDGYRGEGGVHRHAWSAPSGIGSPLVLAVLDAARLVRFGLPAVPPAPPWPGLVLMLKSPPQQSDECARWQRQMVTRGWSLRVDGVYGPVSAAVCIAFQREKGLGVDGRVGPQTWAAAWSSPVTS